ncbi:MAG TPA: NAD(P)/FAD-dependent oxidoreductase [Candidatus Paceibacterota bacterium]|nr:NAD(P)/FAD-dependent oxidoreductase [Candidatus Paceibacterota bacterium]
MPKIVILGGGFGGVRCALDLEHKIGQEAEITLIDRNNNHFFTPSLYEVASAYPEAVEDKFQMRLRRAVAVPYSEIFENKNIDIIEAEITGVDLDAKKITLDGGEHIEFDYLVLSLGSQSSDFGIPGVNEYAYRFKTTNDAISLNQKMDRLFHEAASGLVQLPVKILLIGAGFTGIELAAELVSCATKISQKHGLNRRSFSVTIFEAAPTILPMVGDEERKTIVSRLTDLGVVIMTNSAIEEVRSDSVKLKSGQLMTGTIVVWTAGVRPNELLSSIQGLPLTAHKRVQVDQNLRVPGLDGVYALGDLAEFIDPKTQKPVPGLAYVAQHQGEVVADNIVASMRGKQAKTYHPDYESWIAPVGGKYAVAHINKGMTVSGVSGWLVRGVADLRYFKSILPLPKALKLFTKDLLLFSKND